MEEELISKKDLLIETGISYGQLYRWKRKNIIPEEWFIKKSVSTGQETFFPKHKILERIEMIVNMKDEASLDDLAKMFSVEIEHSSIDLDRLVKKNVLTEQAIQMYKEMMILKELDQMQQVVSAKILKDKLAGGELTLPECQSLMRFIHNNFEQLTSESARVYVLRAMGVPFVMGAKSEKDIIFSEEYKVVSKMSLYEEVSTIKFELM
ncbi:MAG: DUF4004 family protein [Niameybacter sp.]|uniref:DUF4004 family protein n=1 Tax=Niameybacter sp. TaxID=2033640 RepID=UPI002FC6E625